MYGQCPNSTNCRRAKTPEFWTSVHIFRQYFQNLREKQQYLNSKIFCKNLRGKNNNIFKAKNWTIFQSTIFKAKIWAYRYFKITKKREKINQYWKKKFLKQRRKKNTQKQQKKTPPAWLFLIFPKIHKESKRICNIESVPQLNRSYHDM